MDALQANIIATCPSGFSGVTGDLFARAVMTAIVTHCTIFDDYQWPRDRSDEIMEKAAGGISYDFIIVGGGTAGSLVAGRLSNLYPLSSVLLVEAGDDPGLDSEVPAFAFFNLNTPIDWYYNISPNGKSCLGFKNNSCIWSKGKSLGGSSAINAMLYLRGHPKNFDEWEESGNIGWGYENLAIYFDNIEQDLKLKNYKYHKNPWYSIIENAWKELGFSQHSEDSHEAVIGTRITKLLAINGKRLNPAKIYLNTNNLHVMKNTLVEKIIIDPESKIATGIKLRNQNGIVREISANKEVIVSAGSIGTPQILMLSGIGPRKHLEINGIKCIMNLPVGHNLQDHLLLPLFLKTNLMTNLSSEVISLLSLQYMLTRTGPFSNVGVTDYMGFIDTQNLGYPDVQYHHTYFTMNDKALNPYLENIGFKEEIIETIEKFNEGSDLLGIYPTLLHPKSNGEVLLADKNPLSKPIIKANYFEHPDDLKTFLRSIDFIRKLEGTATFKSLDIKLAELEIPDCKKNTTKYWECYIRHISTTTYHPVGTAKMGPRTDATTVVDLDLLVHGIKKLRVVDASIMPTIPGGNTMAPTLAIAEKAVEIIKKQHKFKDEL